MTTRVPALYQPAFLATEKICGTDVEIVGVSDFLILAGDSYLVLDSKMARRIDEQNHPEILLQGQLYGWLFESCGIAPRGLQVHKSLGHGIHTRKELLANFDAVSLKKSPSEVLICAINKGNISILLCLRPATVSKPTAEALSPSHRLIGLCRQSFEAQEPLQLCQSRSDTVIGIETISPVPLGISHVWLLKVVRRLKEDPSEVRRLQAYGDPKLAELIRAQECTREMKQRGELRLSRR